MKKPRGTAAVHVEAEIIKNLALLCVYSMSMSILPAIATVSYSLSEADMQEQNIIGKISHDKNVIKCGMSLDRNVKMC
jgi:glutamine cyclotransferase